MKVTKLDDYKYRANEGLKEIFFTFIRTKQIVQEGYSRTRHYRTYASYIDPRTGKEVKTGYSTFIDFRWFIKHEVLPKAPDNIKLTPAQKLVIQRADEKNDYMLYKPHERVLKALDELGLIESVGTGFGYRHGVLYKLTEKGLKLRKKYDKGHDKIFRL